jgi:DNA repair protein RadD
MILRPYQEDAKAAIYSHLRERGDSPVCVIPTAGGKTPIMASICKDVVAHGGRVLILAHVKELLEQTADKLTRVCPEVNYGIYSAGLRRRDTDNQVIVAGIQSVYKRACELDAFDLIMVDECCPAGTAIITPKGPVPIERIRAGDVVLNALGRGEVLATSARPARDLVTLEFSDGTRLTCTAGHPIFTERGWTAAGLMECGAMAFGVEDLRILRARVSPLEQAASQWAGTGHERAPLATAAFLLDILLQEAQQPDGLSSHAAQGQFELASKESSTADSGRKRTPPSSLTTGAFGNPGTILGSRVCSVNTDAESIWLANSLQDRSSEPSDLDGHRNRRPLSRSSYQARTGSPEDGLPCGKRLVRLTHHKRTRPVVVYNLHVAGHPSYYANGLLVHNCHLIPEDGDSMYRQFLADACAINPRLRIIGFTATPFRLKSGPICTPEGYLNHICYEISVSELIEQGYLSKLVSKAGAVEADFGRLHIRAGEFVEAEVEELMNQDQLVESACKEIMEYTQARKAVLIFASGIQHGWHIVNVLASKHGIECGYIIGETPDHERDSTLTRFRSGQLKYLCNVNVLTTGFDAPHIDCIALLRPTMSAGLYYQMVGRGFRLHPGKDNCLVLDYGGNVLRHGPVDRLRPKARAAGDGEAPAKKCPECRLLMPAGTAKCPECGYVFPDRTRAKHAAEASAVPILSTQGPTTTTTIRYVVRHVYYTVHHKRGAPDDAPRTMRVDYVCDDHERRSEWICFEHQGYPRQKAIEWWTRRSLDPVPRTAEEAVRLARRGRLPKTLAITVRYTSGDQYERIIDYELTTEPEMCQWRGR